MLSQREGSASAVRAHEELFAYWASRRDGLRLPSRSNINPEDFKRHLPTVSLIDVGLEGVDYRLRLAGTGLYEVYRGEITGKRLEEVYEPTAAAYWRSELDKVVQTAAPVWAPIPWPGEARRTCLSSGYGCRWRRTGGGWT